MCGPNLHFSEIKVLNNKIEWNPKLMDAYNRFAFVGANAQLFINDIKKIKRGVVYVLVFKKTIAGDVVITPNIPFELNGDTTATTIELSGDEDSFFTARITNLDNTTVIIELAGGSSSNITLPIGMAGVSGLSAALGAINQGINQNTQDIAVNSAKVGITAAQANAIVQNTADIAQKLSADMDGATPFNFLSSTINSTIAVAIIANMSGRVIDLNNDAVVNQILPDSSPIGTTINFTQLGAPDITFSPQGTLRNASNHTRIAGQHSTVTVRKIAATVWLLTGETKI